jgi:hypothetical protein
VNPQELDRLNNNGIKAMGCGNLETACQLFERCLQEPAGDPFFAIGPAYALATFHWGEYGNGVVAKARFEFVIETGKSALAVCAMARKLGKANKLDVNLDFAEKFIPQQMGNAAENLMLLSTSYEEFDKWAEELRRIAPKEPILTELVPSVNAAREQGTPWAEQMFQRACSYINIGHFGSAIHPASGACILHLMLTNRRQLRMRQEVWQRAIMAYNATIYEIGYKAEKLIRASKGNEAQELSGIQQFLVPLTKEYCDAYPQDEQIATLLSNAGKIAAQYQRVKPRETSDKPGLSTTEERASEPKAANPSPIALVGPFWVGNLLLLAGVVCAVRKLFFSAQHSWWLVAALVGASWILLVLHKRWLGNQKGRASTDCLHLDNQGLRELPTEVCQMKHLKELHLRNNALQALPEDIGNLANLELLMVSGNALTTVPESIVKLKKLRVLGLSTNALERLPKDIGEMSSLVEIHAGGNRLRELPVSLGKLRELVKLNVSNNRLSSLPIELKNIPTLKFLYLHDNPALGLTAGELGPLWIEVKMGATPKPPRELIECLTRAKG